MLLPCTLPRGSWTTLLSPPVGTNSNGWDGYCIVTTMPALSRVGSAYRLTLTPVSAGTSCVLASVWLGMSGTAPSFDGNQFQIKFSGSNGVTLASGGSAVVSDIVVPATNLNTSGVPMIAFGITSGDVSRNLSATGYTMYYKAADSANAGTTSKAGYSTVASANNILSKLEALT